MLRPPQSNARPPIYFIIPGIAQNDKILGSSVQET